MTQHERALSSSFLSVQRHAHTHRGSSNESFIPSTCPCPCERFSSPSSPLLLHALPAALLPFPHALEVRRLQPAAHSAQRGYGLVWRVPPRHIICTVPGRGMSHMVFLDLLKVSVVSGLKSPLLCIVHWSSRIQNKYTIFLRLWRLHRRITRSCLRFWASYFLAQFHDTLLLQSACRLVFDAQSVFQVHWVGFGFCWALPRTIFCQSSLWPKKNANSRLSLGSPRLSFSSRCFWTDSSHRTSKNTWTTYKLCWTPVQQIQQLRPMLRWMNHTVCFHSLPANKSVLQCTDAERTTVFVVMWCLFL